MPFYGQNGQRNDGLYFVMTSSSWTLIVLAYQMKNPLTGQSAAHRARYETDMVGSSVTAVHFLSFRCLQSFAGLSKGGDVVSLSCRFAGNRNASFIVFPKTAWGADGFYRCWILFRQQAAIFHWKMIRGGYTMADRENVLTTDNTTDFPESFLEECGIEFISLSYVIDGVI